jgi:hypothetical protein
MLPSSALKVVDQSPAKLVIVDPPNYLVGFILGVVAVLILAVAIFLFRYHDARRIGAYFGIALSLLFLFIAAWSGTGETTLTLSRDTGILEVQPTSLGSADHATQIPLSKIKRANVETLPSTRRLVLILDAAEPVTLVDASGRDGYYQAADAINNFLHVSK